MEDSQHLELMTLGQVLERADALPWDKAVFLPNDSVWSLESICAICETAEYEDNEEIRQEMAKCNLAYALGLSAVQDIVANAKEQSPLCKLEGLLRAFLFYYDNDAFIVLG